MVDAKTSVSWTSDPVKLTARTMPRLLRALSSCPSFMSFIPLVSLCCRISVSPLGVGVCKAACGRLGSDENRNLFPDGSHPSCLVSYPFSLSWMCDNAAQLLCTTSIYSASSQGRPNAILEEGLPGISMSLKDQTVQMKRTSLANGSPLSSVITVPGWL